MNKERSSTGKWVQFRLDYLRTQQIWRSEINLKFGFLTIQHKKEKEEKHSSAAVSPWVSNPRPPVPTLRVWAHDSLSFQ